MRSALVSLLIPIVLIGCAKVTKEVKAPERPLVLVEGNDVPAFEDDLDRESLRNAISWSMDFLRRLPEDRLFEYGEDQYSTDHLIKSMETFLWIVEEPCFTPGTTNLSLKEASFPMRSIGGPCIRGRTI